MVAMAVVMLDECFDLVFQITRQEVDVLQHAVLERLVPAFDLAQSLGMERSAANVAHALRFDVVHQFTRDVAGPLWLSRRGFMQHIGALAA